MSPLKAIITLFVIFTCSPGAVLSAETGTTRRVSEIKESPYRDAKTVATLPEDNKVELLGRQGGWYQVKSPEGEGWVRMLSIRRGDALKREMEAGELVGLASGRAGTGQVVATTGIRGLNEEELKNSNYNESDLEKVESFAVSPENAREFATEAKLEAQKVEYLRTPD